MKKWKEMARRLAGSLLAACVAVGRYPWFPVRITSLHRIFRRDIP